MPPATDPPTADRPASDQPAYDHRQSAVALAAALGTVSLVAIVLVALSSPAAAAAVAVVFAVVALVGVAFSALRTTVDDQRVVVAFRFGWPNRTIPLAAITANRPVRNRWWWGLGIRLVPGPGLMYNVWGLDAVEVIYTGGRSRTRHFRIGTDDPQGLDAAITAGRTGG